MSATDDLPDGLPRGFDLSLADRGERVETTDGTTYVVLGSPGVNRQLVHADVVDYGTIDHPMLMGFAGMLVLATAFLGPVLAAFAFVAPTVGMGASIAVTAGAILGGWVLSNVLLYRTPVGTQVFRFLEWNDVKHLVLGGAAA